MLISADAMLSPGEKAAIHRALSAAKGDRAVAAEALGLTEEEIGEKILQSPELTVLWSSSRGGKLPPTLADTFDRERPARATPSDLDDPVDLGGEITSQSRQQEKAAIVANSMLLQDATLQKFDWEGLGVTNPKTAELMRQFEVGVGRGIVRLLDAFTGGMAYCFAQVSARFAYAAERLEDPRVQADPALYAHWHDIFIACAKEMKGFNKEATNAAHTRLLIADRAKKMQAAGDRLRKPGWKKVIPAQAPANAA